MLQAGTEAPEHKLVGLDGGEQSLRALAADGPVLLAFFKVSCPVCQLALPFLERLKGGAVRVVPVSQDDAKATRDFHKAFGVTLETLLDEKVRRYPASNAFGIRQVPSLFQIEPNGTVSHAWEGFSKADMEALGKRAGREIFREGEKVPLFRPG